MSKINQAQEIKSIKSRFNNVERYLSQQTWFKKEKWLVSAHGFPNDKNPEAITFHLFKKHWWNEDRQGIHIESFLPLGKKIQKSYVTLHLLHTKHIPGTKLKREVLSKPFVDAIFDEVSQWPGYKFRVGKYGTQPFTRILDGNDPTFEEELAEECARICTRLSPILEKLLKELI